MDDSAKKILSKLEALCAKREYCTSDIERKARKLLGLDCDEGVLEEMLKALVENKFVDDSRYAAAFAREKSSLIGWGPYKIRMALAAKHIPERIVTDALLEVDSDGAEEKLRRLIESKRKTLEGDPYIKLKLIRFALSRGYEYSLVAEIVDQAI